MAYNNLAQKYSRPSLIIWSEDEPLLGAAGTSRDGK
jgi:hypothetical protein